MNDLFLTGMNRRARNSVERQRKSLRRRARDGLHRVLGAVDALVAAEGTQTIAVFRDAQNPPALIEAAIACRAYERLEARGHLDAMLARYGTLRQYLPAFLALPFQATAGSETLLQAVESLRALDAGTRGPLTTNDPHGFVQADWRSHLVSDGKLDRAIWEVSLAFAVRDALRAGSLFLAHSRDHVSFWNLVYDDKSWQQAREQAYGRLDLPTDGQAFLARLGAELDRAARAAQRGLPGNRFAAVRNGRLKLKRRDALLIPPVLRELRATIGASLPRVRIEDLLQDVDEWCGFTRAFQPLGGYQPRGGDPHRSLLATLIAHGTNLGLAAMSHSVDSLTADALQDTSRWFLRDATLKAANAVLVDHHHGLKLSGVWGDGSRSSSDGQRFVVERDSLLGSVYPHYFGYYDRALQLYTHTSDQHSVYATQAISCMPREAGYVLAGILDNDTALPIREHTSDTHGFTVMWTVKPGVFRPVPTSLHVWCRPAHCNVSRFGWGPFLRPGLQHLGASRAAAVKDGRRPPRSGARWASLTAASTALDSGMPGFPALGSVLQCRGPGVGEAGALRPDHGWRLMSASSRSIRAAVQRWRSTSCGQPRVSASSASASSSVRRSRRRGA